MNQRGCEGPQSLIHTKLCWEVNRHTVQCSVLVGLAVLAGVWLRASELENSAGLCNCNL